MPTYQQMGHHSHNLLAEERLEIFDGAILSPVNYTPEKARTVAEYCRAERQGWDVLLDPQLYYPNTDRGFLDRWDYFPADVDTADLSSTSWWEALVDGVKDDAIELEVDGVCSPVAVPRTFSNSYYSHSVLVGSMLNERLSSQSTRVLQSALVSLDDLSAPGRSAEVASILSSSRISELYLVIVSDREPRREYDDTEGIKGVMRLIRLLENAGVRTLVSFSSSDMLLWKAAGAASCATGKFFNLRRFTSSRFEEPAAGGGQLPYFFEEGLVASLREADLIRLYRRGMLSEASLRNPYLPEIMAKIEASEPWVALGWRQYLYWFASAEDRLNTGSLDIWNCLLQAERAWRTLEDQRVLMEEPRNDGSWIRPWRRALAEFTDVEP